MQTLYCYVIDTHHRIDVTSSLRLFIFTDGKGFQPQMYLDRILLDKSLTQLMDKESEMTSSIRSLDSSMQTLVYENYNKFIGATDTIRKVGLWQGA